jgi:hypothetical protein
MIYNGKDGNSALEVWMMKRRIRLTVLTAALLFLTVADLISAADAPKISKEALSTMLGNPDVVIIDVRTERDWTRSDRRIKGAVWEDSEEVEQWANKYPRDKTIILY